MNVTTSSARVATCSMRSTSMNRPPRALPNRMTKCIRSAMLKLSYEIS